jgi:hypothetical protein
LDEKPKEENRYLKNNNNDKKRKNIDHLKDHSPSGTTCRLSFCAFDRHLHLPSRLRVDAVSRRLQLI